MNEEERILDLKRRLYAAIPEHLFSAEQISVVQGLLYDAVDDAVDLAKPHREPPLYMP